MAKNGPPSESVSRPDALTLSRKVSEVFLPSAPMGEVSLFAGRIRQIAKVFDAINQPGLHAVIYGERGVGKTSLANIVGPMAQQMSVNVLARRVNCDSSDSFSSVWRKAFGQFSYSKMKLPPGFTGEAVTEIRNLGETLPDNTTPHDIQTILLGLGGKFVLIFDEFDRLPTAVRATFTDLIKSMSDYSVPSTLIVVGVADTVEGLVRDHKSIERALSQISMPRMSRLELQEIIEKGAQKLSIVFELGVIQQIARLSQGLPHFTHLLALNAARAALMNRTSRLVTEVDFKAGLAGALEGVQQSVAVAYDMAVSSSRQDALFREVLLACSLAKKNEMSCFRAKDVESPLAAVLGRDVTISVFAGHLKQFCQPERGPVLDRLGQERRYRYRFHDPLVEPFAMMRGLEAGLVSPETLAAM